jgi:dipeptide/tripeptide permease
MSQTQTQPAGKLPPQTKFIVGNEACERFSFYGMRAILTLYCINVLTMTKAQATEVGHLFNMSVYFLPLIGAWIADRWWGRYRTILYISLVYCLGNAMLAFSVGSQYGLYAGILLIAIGAGGIKPCVSAFVGDQFGPDQGHLLTKVYSLFYWSINFGSFFAFGFIPSIRDNYGYRWAFGVPGVTMALATIVFWLGRKRYVMKKPSRETKQAGFFRVFAAAWKQRAARQPGQSFLDGARATFSAGEVEAVKAVAGILVVFAPIPIFWSLFDQQFTTWVLQGNKMKTETFLPFQVSQGTKPDFVSADFRDPVALAGKLRTGTYLSAVGDSLRFISPSLADQLQNGTNQVAGLLGRRLSPETWRLVSQPALARAQGENLSALLAGDFNQVIQGKSIYAANRFAGVKLSDRCQMMLDPLPQGPGLVRLNRRLLEETFPADLVPRYQPNKAFKLVLVKLLYTEISPDEFGFRFDAERMLSLNPLLVMLLIPLFTAWFYPLWGRLGFPATPLRRMAVGMILAAAAFVVCGWLQWRLDHGQKLSILWQALPYLIITAGEVMLSVTGLEFAFSQAPKSVKSTIMSFWLLTVAVGNLLVVIVTGLNDKVVKAEGAKEFLFYAILMFLVAGIFIALAVRYKERKFDDQAA